MAVNKFPMVGEGGEPGTERPPAPCNPDMALVWKIVDLAKTIENLEAQLAEAKAELDKRSAA